MLIDNLEIVHGTYDDYLQLAHHHYLSPACLPFEQIFIIRGKGTYRTKFPTPIGAIVYRKPIADIRCRRYATKNYFKIPSTRADRLRLVNSKIIYAARIIIEPRFWKHGLASWLQSETLKVQTMPIVETLTPIDFTYKFLMPAGFRRFLNPAPAYYTKFSNQLRSFGITERNLSNPQIVHQRFMMMRGQEHFDFEEAIQNFLRHFKNAPIDNLELPRTKYALGKLPYPESYWIWFNPRVPSYNFDKAELQAKNNAPTQMPSNQKHNK